MDCNCGSKRVTTRATNNDAGNQVFFCRCAECGARSPEADTRQGAQMQWNRTYRGIRSGFASGCGATLVLLAAGGLGWLLSKVL